MLVIGLNRCAPHIRWMWWQVGEIILLLSLLHDNSISCCGLEYDTQIEGHVDPVTIGQHAVVWLRIVRSSWGWIRYYYIRRAQNIRPDSAEGEWTQYLSGRRGNRRRLCTYSGRRSAAVFLIH